ncbi:hypothetical protein [Streptobotrys caulophylli fusagravirus 1]|nr:hypothetical protein [Streptobotrys caulophylli fusagravirus 1]
MHSQALGPEQTVGRAYPMMSSYGIQQVNQISSVLIDATASNVALSSRGSNLDSSVVSAGPASTAEQNFLSSTALNAWNASIKRLQLAYSLSFPYIRLIATLLLLSFLSLFFLSFLYFFLLYLRYPSPNKYFSRSLRLWIFRSTHRRRFRFSGTPSLPEAIKRAKRLISRHERRARSALRAMSFDPTPELETFFSQIKRLAIEAELHNKTMHSLNGNIVVPAAMESIDAVRQYESKSQVIAEWKSQALPELAGAAVVLTEFLHGVKLDNDSSGPLSASRFPVEVIDKALNMHQGVVTSPNFYNQQFPQFSGRLPRQVSDDTKFQLLAPVRNCPSIPSSRRVMAPVPITDSTFQPEFSNLVHLFSGITTGDELRAVSSSLAVHRFAGMKGNRTVQGYESDFEIRGHNWREMATIMEYGQLYYSFGYRLWKSYFEASIFQAVRLGGRRGVRPSVANPVSLASLAQSQHEPDTPLGAFSVYHTFSLAGVIGQVGLHGEAPLFGESDMPCGIPAVNQANRQLFSGSSAPVSPAALRDGLANGEVQFIDSTGLTTRQVACAVAHFLPMDGNRFQQVNLGSTDSPSYFRSPLSRHSEVRAHTQDVPSGANVFIIHHGNRRPFLTVDDRRAYELQVFGFATDSRDTAPVQGDLIFNRIFDRSDITGVLRHWIIRHYAGTDFWKAFDAVRYRLLAFTPSASPTASTTASHNVTDSWAQRDLRLPADYSAPAYLSIFRTPAVLASDAPDCNAYLSMTPTRLLWNTMLACHANAVSQNWASYGFSLLGSELSVNTVIRGNTPETRFNLASQMFEVLSEIELSPWSVISRAAVGVMYGFRPIPESLASTAQRPVAETAPHLPLYLANSYHEMWMLETIPRHMLLPIHEGLPSWPENEPAPLITGYDRELPKVRLGRDTAPFAGRAFLQDGGMSANLQYYVAVGTRGSVNDLPQWRSDGADRSDLRIGSWVSPFQYEWPADPSTFGVSFLADSGPFSNYAVPGSIRNYASGANRIRASGITAIRRPAPALPSTSPVPPRPRSPSGGGAEPGHVYGDRWYQMVACNDCAQHPGGLVVRDNTFGQAAYHAFGPDHQFIRLPPGSSADTLPATLAELPPGMTPPPYATEGDWERPPPNTSFSFLLLTAEQSGLPPGQRGWDLSEDDGVYAWIYVPRRIGPPPPEPEGSAPAAPPPAPSAPVVSPPQPPQDYRFPWAEMTLRKVNMAVSLSYIAPAAYKTTREPSPNYFSLMIWGNPDSGAYSGMTFARPNDAEVGLPPPAPSAFPQAGRPLGSLPSYLANHNDPHVPKAGRSSRPPAQASAGERILPTSEFVPPSAPKRLPGATYTPHNPTDLSAASQRLLNLVNGKGKGVSFAAFPPKPSGSKPRARPDRATRLQERKDMLNRSSDNVYPDSRRKRGEE